MAERITRCGTPSKLSGLCEDQFRPQKNPNIKRTLKPDAVPTILSKVLNVDEPARNSAPEPPESSPKKQVVFGDITNKMNVSWAVLDQSLSDVSLISAEHDPTSRTLDMSSSSQLVLDESTGEFCSLQEHHCEDGFLDENSGSFTCSHQSSLNEASICYEQSMEDQVEARVTEYEETLKQRLKTIADMEHRIASLQQINADLSANHDPCRKESGRLKKQVDRLQLEVQRGNYSPYLTADQMKRLKRKSSRGMEWKDCYIREGLIMKMRCGTSGYSAFVSKYPLLPAVRTLQSAVADIKFRPGILHEMFQLLSDLSKILPDIQKDCQIAMDEVALKPGMSYCHSLKELVGKATLSSHSGDATKALVVLLAGISKRWKISVAVELTNKKSVENSVKGNDSTGQAYTSLINTVLEKAQAAGLRVCSVSTDMGSDNLAMWKSLGISGGKNKEVVSSINNPYRPADQFFVMPDSVHLFKAIKKLMEKNRIVTLPDDIVQQENLPSSIVDYQHIEDLFEFEKGNELKCAFRLRADNINCKGHFKTMGVGQARAVVCHRSAVGLERMAKALENPSYKTTAWFIELVNTFFTLVTARHRGLAISKQNPEAYEKAINLIKKTACVFSYMTTGNSFKPAQRGMRVLCNSLLGLIDYFLEKRGYSFLMLGRFTSDCIENLFSLIRLCQPTPLASQFLQSLKVVSLSQYSEAIKGSSYDYEESSPITSDFLSEARKRGKERAYNRFLSGLDELSDSENVIKELTQEDYELIGALEKEVIYDMAGSVIRAIENSNVKTCETCIMACKLGAEDPRHPQSEFTSMKEFTLLRADDGTIQSQIHVSDPVYKAILTAEISFRLYREKTLSFKNVDVEQYFVENLMYVWSGSGVPCCHDLHRKILKFYFNGRLKEYGKMLREEARENEAVQRSSKSLAMRQAADNM
ncbi:Transposable element P transposase [Frankliniella fusca]|uniref:Transposable element P transposase n=1 Tax=Frankliniella fusca TaxID=407009 RepID=A0AAE1LVI8_9NEOP|nr:Transposable element P transposase [Frankliniella fusca]